VPCEIYPESLFPVGISSEPIEFAERNVKVDNITVCEYVTNPNAGEAFCPG
jgi:hypothetical protein